jgi:hypothetical protein
LTAETRTFCFPGFFWGLTLRLASSFGWTPRGALRDGSLARTCYCRPLGQRVTLDDAVQLGAALERALPDIPDEELEVNLEPGATMATVPVFHVFSGRNKKALSAFVDYCRRGSFVIR